MIERSISSSGRAGWRYARREDFRGIGGRQHAKADAYGRNDERDEIPSEEGAAQQLEQILASGRTQFWRDRICTPEVGHRAMRRVGMPVLRADQETSRSGRRSSDVADRSDLCWQITIPIGISKTSPIQKSVPRFAILSRTRAAQMSGKTIPPQRRILTKVS
jgi:hypothetical protein